jgi:hypothetical protein
MLGQHGYRRLWSDFVLDIYGGVTPPLNADAPATGTKLVRITVGSNAVTQPFSAMQPNPVSPEYINTITVATEAGQNTKTTILNVTVDGVGPTSYTYTINTGGPDTSTWLYTLNLAHFFSMNIPQIAFIPYAALGIVARGLPGLAVTLADGGGTSGSPALTIPTGGSILQPASRSGQYTLQMGLPSGGTLAKTTDVWSGVGLATGVATYGRLVLPADDAAQTGSGNSWEIRAQGAIATSGAEITMSNTTITQGATTTVDAASITKPTGA